MEDLGNDIYQLPVPGHYDCGYSYGAGRDLAPAPPPKHPARQLRPASQCWASPPSRTEAALYLDSPRPVSPPIVLPNSFTAHKREAEAESDVSSFTSSRQPSTVSTVDVATSTPSPATSRSSSTREARKAEIEPDPLPSHSNPQQLTPTQIAAYAGPRPVQPMRLSRRRVIDSYSGKPIYEISDETKHKISGSSIHQVYDSAIGKSVGTIGFSSDTKDDIAAILRGRDVFLRRETPTSNRWLFKPSALSPALTKKGGSWYWLRDKTRGGVALADAKKNGTVIARIQRDLLSFDKPGLSPETVAEICMAAMALAELARRHRQPQQGSDLGASIAQVALGESADKDDDDLEKLSKMRRRLTLTLRQ